MASCHATDSTKPLVALKLVEDKPPTALLRCRDEPNPPKSPATKGQTMAYAIDAIGFGRDCKGRLDAVRQKYYPDGTPAGGEGS